MTRKDPHSGRRAAPRPTASAARDDGGDEMSRAEIEVMLRELQQHQIELYAKNTELRQLQSQYQALHQCYFDLYNRAPVGYLTIDSDGIVHDANETTGALLRFTPPELRGHPLDRFIDGESAGRFRDYCAMAAEERAGQSCELLLARSDGSRLWVRAVVAEDEGSDELLRVVLVDIDKRKRAEAAAAAANQMFEQAFDLTPDAMSVNRIADQVTIAINRGFTRTTGYQPEDIIGRTSLQLRRWVDEDARARFFERLQREGRIDGQEVEFRNKDGSTMVGLLSAALIDVDGEPHCIAGYRDITARKNYEDALAAAHQKLALQFEAAPLAFIEWDLDFKVVDWNPAAERIFGYSVGEAVGRDFRFIVPDEVVADIASVIVEMRMGSRAGTRSRNANLRKDGQIIECEWYNASLVAPDGRITGYVSLVDDITVRRRTEHALAASEQRFRSAFELSPGPMFLNRVDDNTFVVVNQSFTAVTGYAAQDVIGRTTKDIAMWVDPAERTRLIELLRNGSTVSNFEAMLRHKSGRSLDVVLAVASVELDGVPHYITMLRDITEQKAASGAMRRSEQKFRSAFDLSPDAMALARLDDGMINAANKGFTDLLGYAEHEVVDHTSTELGIWCDPAERVAMTEQVRRNGTLADFPARFRCKDGREVIGLLAATMISVDGVPHVITTIRDVTRQREAELRLRASEARFRVLFDLSPDAIALSRFDDEVFVAVNQGYATMTGYSADETVGFCATGMNRWVDPAARRRYRKRLVEERVVTDLEITLRQKSGRVVEAVLSATVVDLDGMPHVIATMRDVTARNRALRETRESEEKFRQAFDLNPDSMSILRVRDEVLVAVNRGFTELSGHTPGETLGSPDIPVARWVDPEHRRRVVDAVMRGDQVRNAEFDLRRKDGSVRHCVAHLARIDIGGEAHILSSVRDVTAQRQTLQAMQENEAKFRSAFEASPDAISIARMTDGALIAVNRGFTEVSGYAPEEVIGDPAVPVRRWADPLQRRTMIDATFRGQTVRNAEVLMRRKDGMLRECLVTLLPIQLNDQPHLLSYVRDVTTERQALRAVQESEERFRKSFEVSPDSLVIVRPEDDTLVAVNRGFIDLSGYTVEESVGTNRVPQVRWVDPQQRRRLTEAAARGEPVRNVEVLMRRKDGAVRTCLMSMVPIDLNGVRHVLSCAHDVSEQLQAARIVEESEAKFRGAFDLSPDALHIERLDDGIVLAVSRGFTELTEYPAAEAIGRSSVALPYWADPADRAALVALLRRDRVVRRHEAQFRTRSGRIFTGELASALIELNGVEHAIGSLRDVTAQRLAERQLRSSELKFRLAFDLNPSAMSLSRLADGLMLATNHGYQQIVGYSESECLGHTSQDLEIWADSADRQRMVELLQLNQLVDHPARLRNKGGRFVDVELTGAQFDIEGVPHVLTTVRATGEHRRLVEALRRGEEKFRRVFDLLPQGAMLTRVRDGRIVAVNQAYSTLYGYAANEALGRTTVELEHWAEPTQRDELLRQLSERGTVRAFRTHLRTRAGQDVSAQIAVTVVDVDGEPHLLAIATELPADAGA